MHVHALYCTLLRVPASMATCCCACHCAITSAAHTSAVRLNIEKMKRNSEFSEKQGTKDLQAR